MDGVEERTIRLSKTAMPKGACLISFSVTKRLEDSLVPSGWGAKGCVLRGQEQTYRGAADGSSVAAAWTNRLRETDSGSGLDAVLPGEALSAKYAPRLRVKFLRAYLGQFEGDASRSAAKAVAEAKAALAKAEEEAAAA